MNISDPFNHLGSIWYPSEPLSQTSFLVGTFFATSYSKTALAVWPIHSVTMLARFFSSEPRRPKSLLCGTKFHLQRAQEALSVEHLVASTDIFYGSFPEVAPDARRHAMRRHRSFSKIPVQYLILKEAHNG